MKQVTKILNCILLLLLCSIWSCNQQDDENNNSPHVMRCTLDGAEFEDLNATGKFVNNPNGGEIFRMRGQDNGYTLVMDMYIPSRDLLKPLFGYMFAHDVCNRDTAICGELILTGNDVTSEALSTIIGSTFSISFGDHELDAQNKFRGNFTSLPQDKTDNQVFIISDGYYEITVD